MNGPYPSPLALLPHSYPFVLLDRILELEEGKRIVCLKNVTFNEGYFKGHFRDMPIMPGVLIIEAMAQASGLIIGKGNKKGAYLSRVKDARFKKPVVPGDQLVIKASLLQGFASLYSFEAIAYVNDEMVSEAEIILTII
jgi:3-hydroxyacyl-[acyl-carrier-protein] dehydratase